MAPMAINVEIVRTGTENSASLLRRFTRRIQEAGVVSKVKSLRYKDRKQSHFKVKRATLELIDRRKEYERLLKLGKIKPRTHKRR